MSTTTWSNPKPVTMADVAFGPRSIREFLPAETDIPREFWHGHTKWNKLVSEWFFSGLKSAVVAKAGIDRDAALAHLRAVLGSYEPKHEHKEAGVAYLMSLWFDDSSAPAGGGL